MVMSLPAMTMPSLVSSRAYAWRRVRAKALLRRRSRRGTRLRELQHLAQRHRIGDRRRASPALTDISRGLPVLHRLAMGRMTFRQRLIGRHHQHEPVRQTPAKYRGGKLMRAGVVEWPHD